MTIFENVLLFIFSVILFVFCIQVYEETKTPTHNPIVQIHTPAKSSLETPITPPPYTLIESADPLKPPRSPPYTPIESDPLITPHPTTTTTTVSTKTQDKLLEELMKITRRLSETTTKKDSGLVLATDPQGHLVSDTLPLDYMVKNTDQEFADENEGHTGTKMVYALPIIVGTVSCLMFTSILSITAVIIICIATQTPIFEINTWISLFQPTMLKKEITLSFAPWLAYFINWLAKLFKSSLVGEIFHTYYTRAIIGT